MDEVMSLNQLPYYFDESEVEAHGEMEPEVGFDAPVSVLSIALCVDIFPFVG